MRAATALVLLFSLLLLVGVGAFAFTLGAGTAIETTWTSDTARDVRANHHAVAAGHVDGQGMVYAPVSGRAGTPTCALIALDATDGDSRWQYDVPEGDCTIHSVATPTLADYDADGEPEVLAATTEQDLVALDARSGDEEFRANLTSYGYSKPVVADLVGDADAEVAVVDVEGSLSVFDRNGSLQWREQLGAYTWGQPAALDVDADDETELIVGTRDGGLWAFEGNGSVRWQRESIGGVTWSATGTVDDEPAVAVGTTDGEVALFDAESGETRWRQSFGSYAAVHAFGDADDDGTSEVYGVARDGNLRRIDAETGDVAWTTTLTSADVQMTPPPALGDVDGDGEQELIAVTNDGRVSLVDPDDGEVLSTQERNVPIYTYPTVADLDDDGRDEAYVMYSDGRVVRIDAVD
ncbi:MAG: PQQ-binding-like beta-propeller repeat protein [Halolamina sp.]